MTIRRIGLGAFLALAGCATSPPRQAIANESLSPTEIMSDRALYDGQLVLVRGFLSVEPDAICLIDPSHAQDASPPGNASFSILGLEMLRPKFEKFQGKEIVFSARFKTKLAADDQFLLKGCGDPGVLIETEQAPLIISR